MGVCNPKVSKGRSESPLVASADAKPSATKHAILGSKIIRIQKSPNHR